MKRARVVGMLDDGVASLGAAAREALARASLVVGGSRLLTHAAPLLRPDAERFDLTGRLGEVPAHIAEALDAGREVVVLASGDPLCFGIGGFLGRKLGRERLEFLPHLSALQLACARVGMPWNDARIVSVHGRDAGEWTDGTRGPGHGLWPLFRACIDGERIVCFTSPENGPARIARMLLAEGWESSFRLHVAERLMHREERLHRDRSAVDVAAMDFDGPTMLLLERAAPLPPSGPMFGLVDAAFRQRKPEKGLITKLEARAVSLAMLGLRHDSIVWDIGAGSGAVGLEAARLASDGWVFAIEKNAEDSAIARENARLLGVRNFTLVHGRAPQGLEGWPDPDAVFIGGSGGGLAGLIRLALARLRPGGRLVINLVTLENLAAATGALEQAGVRWSVTQLQAARSRPILRMHRLAAENPVWIVTAEAMDACADD